MEWLDALGHACSAVALEPGPEGVRSPVSIPAEMGIQAHNVGEDVSKQI